VDLRSILTAAPLLLVGFETTLAVCAIGVTGALLLGLVGGAVRATGIPVADHAVRGFVEVVRNTPLVVQMFLLYFGLPQVHPTLNAFVAVSLALLLWGAAYNVENFRAGFESVSRDYHEAALALGLSRWSIVLFIVFPIGIRASLPSVTNTCISVIKNSSYSIAIGLPELTTTAINQVALTFRVFEMFAVLAFTYLALVGAISVLMSSVERRMAIPRAA
jgi:His/Glu/Gln/Arg/opine family amino acid ABC transporter permease subunit